mgnify:CR=1 FL=1
MTVRTQVTSEISIKKIDESQFLTLDEKEVAKIEADSKQVKL